MNLYRDFTSQEEIDLEYNLSLSVPDINTWLAWYKEKSVAARKTLACKLDVHFGPTVDETVDIFPAKQKNAPVLVFIHGGYWVRCSSKDFSFVANGLVAQGITVVLTNYSLCPKVTVSEITRQSRAAIAWLYRKAERLSIDPSRIFVAGHSAGGQQVGMLLGTDWQREYGLPANIIRGGIPISGVFDLQPLCHSYLQPKLQLTQEEVLKQSPLYAISESGPPLLITVGEKETAEFRRQSAQYLQAWQDKGNAAEFFLQEGKHHFAAIEDCNAAHSTFCKRIVEFMER